MSNDYFNPPNSVWPNGLKRDGEGYVTFYPLGTNKVDISTVTWPKGDKLVSPFVYQNDELVGFVDTKAMTANSGTTIVMPYEHIEAEFSSIDKSTLQIATPKATFKKASWKNGEMDVIPEAQYKYKGCKTADDVKAVDSNYQTTDIVDGTWTEILCDLENGNPTNTFSGGMFRLCSELTTFTSDLSSLTDGNGMFDSCTNLTTFNSDLSSLTNGKSMFRNCDNLTTFECGDLSSLTIGDSMFGYCSNLTTFTSNLSSLTNGKSMFAYCPNLTTFTSNLSSLTKGDSMFISCSNLTDFTSDLSSLTSGDYMFLSCKLNAYSVKNIIDKINTVSSKKLTLGMGCNDTTEDKDLFAQEVGYTDMTSLLAALTAKGWTVTAQYKGRPTTTYSLRRPSENTLPVFAKIKEDEKHADYTSADGSKKYMLDWFHETTGSTEGYTQFASLEEAVAHFNIKPIERN